VTSQILVKDCTATGLQFPSQSAKGALVDLGNGNGALLVGIAIASRSDANVAFFYHLSDQG
jgi:tRNA1(Val) A37 N6-methylase TrmN6